MSFDNSIGCSAPFIFIRTASFKISVTYVDASDAERNLMLPENEPVFGVITVGSPVDIKVHDG